MGGEGGDGLSESHSRVGAVADRELVPVVDVAVLVRGKGHALRPVAVRRGKSHET